MSLEQITFAENETKVTLPVTTVTKTSVVVLQGETPIIVERIIDDASLDKVAVGDNLIVQKQDGKLTAIADLVKKSDAKGSNGRCAGNHAHAKTLNSILD